MVSSHAVVSKFLHFVINKIFSYDKYKWNNINQYDVTDIMDTEQISMLIKMKF